MTLIALHGVGVEAYADNDVINPALPAGTNEGDLLVAFAHFTTVLGRLTTPDGWHRVSEFRASRDRNANYIYWKIAAQGESPPSLTPVQGATGDGVYGIIAGFTAGTFNPFNPINGVGPVFDGDTAEDIGPIVPPNTFSIHNGAIIFFGSRYVGYSDVLVPMTGDGLTWSEIADHSEGALHIQVSIQLGIWPADTQVLLPSKTIDINNGTGTSTGIAILLNGFDDGFLRSFTFYNTFLKSQLDGTHPVDFDTDNISISLHTSGYSPDPEYHPFYSYIWEEVVGTGYSTGGLQLQNVTCTRNLTTTTVDADDLTFSQNPAGFTNARYAVMRKDTGDPATSPLIGVFNLGGDQSVVSKHLTLAFSPSGLFQWTTN